MSRPAGSSPTSCACPAARPSHWHRWRRTAQRLEGQADGGVDGRPTLAVDATHRISAGLRSMTATGGGRFDALLPPQLRPLFQGDTVIDLAASLDRNGAVTIERGRLSTAALELAASGRYASNGTNDLKARLVGTSGPVPFEWTSGNQTVSAAIEQLTLSVSGPPTAPALRSMAVSPRCNRRRPLCPASISRRRATVLISPAAPGLSIPG